MTNHTYAGRTLDDIKAAAEAATPGPWHSVRNSCFHEICTENRDDAQSLASVHVNPYLNIDAEQERCNSEFMAAANPSTVLAMAARIEELERERDATRLEGFLMAQKTAEDLAEQRVCDEIAQELTRLGAKWVRDDIRAMHLPAEWCDMGFPISSPSADWPHPDGFAGGLTEQQP